MSETIIKVENLTKDYGYDRGIFDLNLEIHKGEVYGYIGTNGSGKTTTIRNMMGFIKPTTGRVEILGMDAWEDSVEIKKHVCYVPGEIAFPGAYSGTEFLKHQAQYLGIRNFDYMNYLIKTLQLDPSANLKRMSKGMKQKTAIVAALMGDKDILILDEPTTGLDPLMRRVFLDLIREEKAKGKTIFMSSHIFEEIEEVCDRVSMIKDGGVLDTVDLNSFRNPSARTFRVAFDEGKKKELMAFEDEIKKLGWFQESAGLWVDMTLPRGNLKDFFYILDKYSIKQLRERGLTLEAHFKQVYGKGGNK